MFPRSKQNSMAFKSPKLKTCKSSELPMTRHPMHLSNKNEQFYSVKQINHKTGVSNEHLSRRQPTSKGENFATTDESSNAHESHFQESLFFAENKKRNDDDRKEKTESTSHTKRKREEIKQTGGTVGFLQAKLRQMRQLVLSHEMELRKMKSEMKERELFRLLKMHSIEKIKILKEATLAKPPNANK